MEKTLDNEATVTQSPAGDVQSIDYIDYNPNKWYNKSLKIAGVSLPPYSNANIQLLMVSIVCFLCPGMYNALSGLGGGGQIDTTTADKANLTLSAISIIGIFYGTLCNRLGLHRTLALGGIGYSVYAASFLCYNFTQNSGFVIFAGALLGACCNCLWSAEGTIMMSYPNENTKGRYIATFWIIFNLGAVIGSIIPLAQNIHATKATNVSNGTYSAFIVLMFLGACVALCLLPTNRVRRSDGSRIITQQNPTWRSELQGLMTVFKTDTYIVMLFPLFFASNFFYTYQFNCVNAAYYSTRTRSLNNLLYWFCQMFGALFFGSILDWTRFNRKMRARICWSLLLVLTMVIWGGGYAFQKKYTRKDSLADDWVVTDWVDHGYVGGMFLYMFYGGYDAIYQSFCYWLMGAMTNNSRKAALFCGFYKGVQAIGGMVIYIIDWKRAEFMVEFGLCWGILVGSILLAGFVAWTKVIETTDVERDLEFSDETLAELYGDSPATKQV